jgi:chromate transporter
MKQSGSDTSLLQLFVIFLRLGLTSFGGPIAHLGYFQDEFVRRRKWLTDHAYGDLVALCQFLPGPASSQVGISVGFMRGGLPGAIVSWLGFTLPSAVLLILFGLGVTRFQEYVSSGWIHGLKVIAVAIVAQAVIGMGRTLCPDKIRVTFAVLAMTFVLLFQSALSQIGVILLGGIFGWIFLRESTATLHVPSGQNLKKRWGSVCLLIFVALLILLPVTAKITANPFLISFDKFYRVGSLVFGGGHVVLPLLQTEVVSVGWLSIDSFLAGYGMAQAVPGPLFTIAGYIGAVSQVEPNGWLGGSVALVAVFLPSFLIILGVLPFWEKIRQYKVLQSMMRGANAGVVGLLMGALYNPVWTHAIQSNYDFATASIAFVGLQYWRLPSWVIVIFGALAGSIPGIFGFN